MGDVEGEREEEGDAFYFCSRCSAVFAGGGMVETQRIDPEAFGGCADPGCD